MIELAEDALLDRVGCGHDILSGLTPWRGFTLFAMART